MTDRVTAKHGHDTKFQFLGDDEGFGGYFAHMDEFGWFATYEKKR